MARDVVNIIVGVAGIAMGLSGRFTFFGTGSAMPLVVVGGLIAAYGVYGAWRHRPQGQKR